jgi:hypothetical protein
MTTTVGWTETGRRGPGASTILSSIARRPSKSIETSSTILATSEPPRWMLEAIRELALRARRLRSSESALAAFEWMLALPDWVRRHSIGGGDDGSISIEWDQAGRTLHVMFLDGTTEAYFIDEASGVEWELSVNGYSPEIVHALRVVS